MPASSVQCVVTSPPYWGLRDYGTAEWDGGEDGCDHLGPPKASDKSGLKNDGRPNPGRKDYELDATVPYLRDCGKCGAKRIDSQLGLEPTPDQYVANLVEVFAEVRRVLRDDGTVWLNLGDSYVSNPTRDGHSGPNALVGSTRRGVQRNMSHRPPGLKPKDLCGIPWSVAFALQADGWWLRSDIIWAKPNPMPESVTDRPTRSHEYIFLLTKSARYFYDADAVREEHATELHHPGNRGKRHDGLDREGQAHHWNPERMDKVWGNPAGRNKRSVWTVATQPFPGAHFATFPPKLIEPCILAGTSPKACGECGSPWERVTERKAMVVRPSERSLTQGDEVNDRRTATSGTMVEAPESVTVGWQPTCTHQDDSGQSLVLDPFCGSGTVGMVALRHNRSFIGLELNPEYVQMSRHRIIDDGPLLNAHLEAA